MSLRHSSIAAALITVLAACAVTPKEVREAKSQIDAEINKAIASSHTATELPPLVEVVERNYHGETGYERRTDTDLPPRYNKVVIGYGDKPANLAKIALNLEGAFGLAVRITPDVSETTPSAAPLANATGNSSNVSPDTYPQSFAGNLTDYLNIIAATGNLTWSYSAERNELTFSRLVTRTFVISDTQGAIQFSDSSTGNTSTQTGTSGGTGGAGGSFSGNLSVTSQGQVNQFTGMQDLIKGMLTKAGSVAGNPATGTLVVKDTRDSVERITQTVREQQTLMLAQIELTIARITVQVNDGSSAGFNLQNLVFQRLNAAGNAANWSLSLASPNNITGSGTGSATYNLNRPNSALSAANLVAQMLSQYGTVVDRNEQVITTKNRVPALYQTATQQAYLASVSPGLASTSGVSLPGLTPGVVGYGDTLLVVPTLHDSQTLSLVLSSSTSSLVSMTTVSSGTGSNIESIQTPTLAQTKYGPLGFNLRNGQMLVVAAKDQTTTESNTNAAMTGLSNNSSNNHSVSVLLITPRILPSI